MTRAAVWLAAAALAAIVAQTVIVLHQASRLTELTTKLASAAADVAALGLRAEMARRALEAERQESAKRVAKARAREKAKSRARRVAVAIPAAGVVVAVLMEESDYREWRKENREPASETDARKLYIEEVVAITKAVLEEEYQDLLQQYPLIRESVHAYLEKLAQKFPSAKQPASGAKLQ